MTAVAIVAYFRFKNHGYKRFDDSPHCTDHLGQVTDAPLTLDVITVPSDDGYQITIAGKEFNVLKDPFHLTVENTNQT